MSALDIKAALKRVAGNEKFYHQNLIKFYNSQENVVKQIKSALLSGDEALMMCYAHKLKGISGNIGARELSRIAGKIELNARNNEAVDLFLEPLSEELMRVQAEINKVIKTSMPVENNKVIKTNMPVEINFNEISPLFSQLYLLLLDDDEKAIKIMNDILEKVAGTTFEKVIQKLSLYISDYKLEDAFDELLTILAENSEIKF